MEKIEETSPSGAEGRRGCSGQRSGAVICKEKSEPSMKVKWKIDNLRTIFSCTNTLWKHLMNTRVDVSRDLRCLQVRSDKDNKTGRFCSLETTMSKMTHVEVGQRTKLSISTRY